MGATDGDYCQVSRWIWIEYNDTIIRTKQWEDCENKGRPCMEHSHASVKVRSGSNTDAKTYRPAEEFPKVPIIAVRSYLDSQLP